MWLADRSRPSRPDNSAAERARSADCVVVGAGIVGLMTAVLLARAGKHVAVVEARTVGACATGNTTGKISLLHATHLAKIVARHGPDLARRYVEGNRAGQDWILRYCREHDIAVQREDAYTYAQSADGVSLVQDELRACRIAGLPASWAAHAAVPFPYHGGVRLPDQAQFDPMPFLDALTDELIERGGSLVEHTRVQEVSGLGKQLRIGIDRGAGGDRMLQAGQLVVATGVPILDRGGYFARVQPNRSYCLAFRVPGSIPRPMMISADSPTRSLRYVPTPDSELLIVGGAGHPVGRSATPSKALAELSSWTRTHFPGAEQTHSWSAQDYAPIDDLPYVGPLLPNDHRILIATGFHKWGMTNGAAAALLLSGYILGEKPGWEPAFASWSRHELAGVATAMRANLMVGLNLARGWITPMTRLGRPGPTATEGGVVSGPPWRLQASCRVDGVQHRVSPVCPHLGGIVSWNDADQAWECPLHGSRFAADGTLLEGPATRDLTRIASEPHTTHRSAADR